jgi:hypothetical protein
MLVKHLSKNEFDIFWNKGWENWGRFEIQGKTLVQTKGVPVPGNIQTFLNNRYCGK